MVESPRRRNLRGGGGFGGERGDGRSRGGKRIAPQGRDSNNCQGASKGQGSHKGGKKTAKED